MAVEAGTFEGALCGIGAGVQTALDIGCDSVVVIGVGAVQPAGDAGGVSADLVCGTNGAEAGPFELDPEGGAADRRNLPAWTACPSSTVFGRVSDWEGGAL